MLPAETSSNTVLALSSIRTIGDLLFLVRWDPAADEMDQIEVPDPTMQQVLREAARVARLLASTAEGMQTIIEADPEGWVR